MGQPDEYEQLMNDLPLLVDPLRNLDGMLTFTAGIITMKKLLWNIERYQSIVQKRYCNIGKASFSDFRLLAAENLIYPL